MIEFQAFFPGEMFRGNRCQKRGILFADDHIRWRMAGVDAHTGIALLFGKVEIAIQSGQLFETVLNIRRLCLDFLYANTIRTGRSNPGLHPFGRGGADAVEVEAG